MNNSTMYSAMSTFLTTKDAAQFLGVTPSRIRQLILEKRLVSIKTGRDHLIEDIELEKFRSVGKRKRGRPARNKILA